MIKDADKTIHEAAAIISANGEVSSTAIGDREEAVENGADNDPDPTALFPRGASIPYRVARNPHISARLSHVRDTRLCLFEMAHIGEARREGSAR